MRPRNALLLLLGQAAALALVSADDGLYTAPDRTDAEQPLPGADESEPTAGFGAALSEQVARSAEMLQSFLRMGEAADAVDAVRIVVINAEEEEAPAAARKTACLKALATLPEPKQLHAQADSILRYFESAFGLGSPEVQRPASCEDLGRAELVAQCKVVVEAQDAVRMLLRGGRTDDQVCDVMSVVTDLAATNDLSCKLCHRLVQMVMQSLTQEVQQVQKVREIIGDLCDVTSADSMCHKFLTNYDDIVEWLRHDTDPAVVCLRLTMCPVETASSREILSLDSILGKEVRERVDEAVAVLDTPTRDSATGGGEILDLDWMFGGAGRMIAADTVATPETQERSSRSEREIMDLGWIFGNEARENADGAAAARDTPVRDSVSDSMTLDLDAIFGDKLRTVADGVVATSDTEEPEQSCSFCTSMTGVIAQVSTRFPDQLWMAKDLLKSVCQMASPVVKCQEVEANFDRVVELVHQGQYPREICRAISVCTQQAALGMEATNDKTCAYCDAATTLIEVILQEAPEQINEIRNYADMICDMLGDDSPCHRYVAKLDTVIDSLNKGGHPRDICKALDYCSGNDMIGSSEPGEKSLIGMIQSDRFGSDVRASTKELGELVDIVDQLSRTMLGQENEHLPRQPSIDYNSCFFCSHVAGVVHYVQGKSPEKLPIVKTILSNVCKLVPSKCKCDVVDEKFEEIVKWDKEGKRPHAICKLLGTCDKTQDEEEDAPAIADELKSVAVASQWPPGDESECAYCQFATTVAKIAVEQYGADIRQVRAYADMICDMLGEDNPCHVYVKQMDFVIDSIAKGMSSKAICVGLEFCPAAVASDEGNALLLMLEELSPRSTPMDRFSTPGLSLVKSPKDSTEGLSDGCFFCMQTAPALQVAVAQDPSQIVQTRQIVEVLCGMLPGDNQCHSFVSKFDAVVDSLRNGVQPTSVCHELQLCLADSLSGVTDSRSGVTDLAVPEMVAVQKRDTESSTCAYCNGVTTVLKTALDQTPEHVKEFHEAAGYICELLPANDMCHKDPSMFAKAVAGLQSGKEPQEVCQMLEMCTPVGDRDEVSGLLDFTGGDFLPTKCATCQQNTLMLASLIDHPDRLAIFEREVSSVCRLVPESAECDLLMKHQGAIIDSLKKNEDVNTICARIGQCAAVAEEEQEKSMPVSCLFCEFIADLVEHAKDSDRALSEAKATLETICTVLPPQARCDVLSSKFDQLLTLMREGKSPSEACHAAALCDAEFVFSPASDSGKDLIVQSFEEARRSMGNVMEVE